jgi:hypothetical protein
MSETLFKLPDRDYEIRTDLDIRVKGNKEQFREDVPKVREALLAAIDEAIEKAAIDG